MSYLSQIWMDFASIWLILKLTVPFPFEFDGCDIRMSGYPFTGEIIRMCEYSSHSLEALGMGIRQGRRLISIQRNATARQQQQRTAIGSHEATASEGRAFSLLRACKKLRSPACLRVRACILAAYILGRIDETIVN